MLFPLILPDLEYLKEDGVFIFPEASKAPEDAPAVFGANLSPGMLISAYSQGYFPWYTEFEPILWWSPDPRFVLFPEELHISGTLKKVIKKKEFSFTVDKAFPDVIRNCSSVPRPGQEGTWIISEMVEAYENLHSLGYAHSIEAWRDEKLVGGLYGVSLGGVFFGESMFRLEPNASKAAFVYLTELLIRRGFTLIDCQVYTPNLKDFGAREIDRETYLSWLKKGLYIPNKKGLWT